MAKKTGYGVYPAKKTGKKGLSSAQWAAFLIIAVMAFSTIAFSFLSGNQTLGQEEPPPVSPPLQQSGTPLAYKATIKARIADLLPSMKLVAATNQVDIEKIDALIRQMPGVLQVVSSFRQNPSNPGAFMYVADIRVSKGASLEAILANLRINSDSGLSQIQFFPSALLEVPQKVVFYNSDLNLSREQVFLDQLRSGYICSQHDNQGQCASGDSSPTQKGDIIQAELDATFTGSELTNLSVFELSNPNIELKTHSITIPLEILSLESALIFTQDTNFSAGLTTMELFEDLNSLPDFNAVNVRVQPAGSAEFKVDSDFNQAVLSGFFQELGVPFTALSNQKPHRFSFEPISVEAYSSLKDSVISQLASQGIPIEKIVFAPFPISIQGRLDLSETGFGNVLQSTQRAKQALFAKLPGIEIYQLGSVKAETLPENPQDTNRISFTVQTGKINVLLFPGQKTGDSVLLNIQFQTKRDYTVIATGIQIVP